MKGMKESNKRNQIQVWLRRNRCKQALGWLFLLLFLGAALFCLWGILRVRRDSQTRWLLFGVAFLLGAVLMAMRIQRIGKRASRPARLGWTETLAGEIEADLAEAGEELPFLGSHCFYFMDEDMFMLLRYKDVAWYYFREQVFEFSETPNFLTVMLPVDSVTTSLNGRRAGELGLVIYDRKGNSYYINGKNCTQEALSLLAEALAALAPGALFGYTHGRGRRAGKNFARFMEEEGIC